MTTKRTKRKYMKPAMQVYELQSPAKILAGSSGGSGGTEDYNPNTPQSW